MKNEKTKRGVAQDRNQVAAGQEYEVNYEKNKTGASGDEVKKAIREKGNGRAGVEKALQGSKKIKK